MGITFTAEDVAFKNLMMAREAGDGNQFDMIANALTVVYGGDNVSVDDISKAFDETMESSRAQVAIDSVNSVVAGHTPTNAFINLVKDASAVAKTFGGNVTIMADLNDDGETISLRAVFRGVAGIKKNGGGNRSGVRYNYFDEGTAIDGSLKKYVLGNFPKSKAAAIIRDYETKDSNVSAWSAVERGMKDGDTFTITREAKDSDS